MPALRAVPHAKRIPEWKIREVEELTRLFKKYKVFAIADLTGLPTSQLQRIRKKLRKKVVFKVSKNTLVKRALRNAGIEDEALFEILQGQNLLLFTDLNPFELNLLLEKYKGTAPYKPGEIADREIIIPSGNTGLSPGPILSTFSKLKIPIKVQGNSIWITKDVKVAKPGDVISEDLASLLQRLGIELKEVKVRIKLAYDDGLLIPGEKLALDLAEYEEKLRRAYLEALNLGVEIVWPEPEIVELAIQRAFRRATALAAEAGFVTPETAEHVFRVAIAKAYALAAEVSKYAPELKLEVPVAVPAAAPAGEEEKKEEAAEEEEKEEAVSEEELAEGLGALFGI